MVYFLAGSQSPGLGVLRFVALATALAITHPILPILWLHGV